MNEVRLIDANALPVQTAFEDEEGRPYQFVQALDIDAAPTIDPVKHARWEAVNEHCNHAAVFRCSGRDGCGASVDYGHYTRFCDYDWCPNCGARMDAEVLSKMETTTEEEKDG